MLSIFDISFWLYFFAFSIAVFFTFFIPGDLLVGKFNLSLFQRIVIGVVVGMVLFAWQGMLVGYMHLRELSYVYLLVVFMAWIKHMGKIDFFQSIKSIQIAIKTNLLLIIVICLGMFIQLSSVWTVAAPDQKGLFFCCGNVSDTIFHLSLTNELVKHFPPFEPGMFGVEVKNYHYFSNLVVAEFIRIWKLPLIITQYQFFMLFISLFLGFSAIVFSQILKMGKKFTFWLTFFLYFGGDLTFLLVSFIRREIQFNMSSLEDGAKFLVNPPRAFSIVIFFIGVSLLILWLKKKNLITGILAMFMLGSLVGFKIYTGIFALIGLAFLGLYFLTQKSFQKVIIILFAFLASAIMYIPVNVNSGGLYFTGFYLFENFIVQPWLMLDRLELARRIYLDHHSWLRVIQYEAIFFLIFTFCVFGTKLIGLIQTKKSLSFFPKEINIFLISGIIVSSIAGFFFQQYSGGANTFNFLVSVFIIGSIYSTLGISYFLEKIGNKGKILIIVVIVVLTVPRVLYQVIVNVSDITERKGFFIDNYELESVKYIREKTLDNAMIMVNYEKFKADADSPYISFLTNRAMFLSGLRTELEGHGIDYSKRKAIVDELLSSTDSARVATLLQQSSIDYLYLSPSDIVIATVSAEFTKTVFQNTRVKLLEVSKDKISTYLKH